MENIADGQPGRPTAFDPSGLGVGSGLGGSGVDAFADTFVDAVLIARSRRAHRGK